MNHDTSFIRKPRLHGVRTVDAGKDGRQKIKLRDEIISSPGGTVLLVSPGKDPENVVRKDTEKLSQAPGACFEPAHPAERKTRSRREDKAGCTLPHLGLEPHYNLVVSIIVPCTTANWPGGSVRSGVSFFFLLPEGG